MSLIYTNGYLKSITVDSMQQSLDSNIKNILIIPPKNNTNNIVVYIYEYDKYHPIYSIHLINNEIFLDNVIISKNKSYSIQAVGGEIQLYYEMEVNNNEF